jgi:hypothetical protein
MNYPRMLRRLMKLASPLRSYLTSALQLKNDAPQVSPTNRQGEHLTTILRKQQKAVAANSEKSQMNAVKFWCGSVAKYVLTHTSVSKWATSKSFNPWTPHMDNFGSFGGSQLVFEIPTYLYLLHITLICIICIQHKGWDIVYYGIPINLSGKW